MSRPTMPTGLTLTRTTPSFTAESVPAGLRNAHEVAEGVWGRLLVSAGTVRFVFEDEADHPIEVVAGAHVDIPPQRRHHVEPSPDAVFSVEFHR